MFVGRTLPPYLLFPAAERQVIDVGLYLARASIGFIDSRQHTTLRQCRALFVSVPCALAGCVDRAGDLRPKFLCADSQTGWLLDQCITWKPRNATSNLLSHAQRRTCFVTRLQRSSHLDGLLPATNDGRYVLHTSTCTCEVHMPTLHVRH